MVSRLMPFGCGRRLRLGDTHGVALLALASFQVDDLCKHSDAGDGVTLRMVFWFGGVGDLG